MVGQPLGVFVGPSHISHTQERLATHQVGFGIVGVQRDGFGEHRDSVHIVTLSSASASIEIMHNRVFAINEQRLLASRRQRSIVLHHVGHLGHTHQDLLVVGLGFGKLLQLLVGRKQVARAHQGQREIVARLKVVAQLQRMLEATHSIGGLTLIEGADTIIFQHIEIFRLLFLFLFFRRLTGTAEQ